MTSYLRIFRPVAVSVAMVTLVAVAAAMAIGLAHPEFGVERYAWAGLAMHPAGPGVYFLHPCRSVQDGGGPTG